MSGALKPNDLKAIGWYAEKNSLRLALSAPPCIHFVDKRGRGLVKDLLIIRTAWENFKKEEKKKSKES